MDGDCSFENAEVAHCGESQFSGARWLISWPQDKCQQSRTAADAPATRYPCRHPAINRLLTN